ncbi:hypothetical protein P153DRAFT_283519 [Dothidotthia symphoricarpi CBS 119687]|uniref:C2H2-type domain-containing protein n=1 Tax=Dothidotthia symphoricarpi CBS 119687 TaxID=1392245 RepID=A0A6A6AQR2_9PLEO|nr:uncharacterized protein P153DRAFT_283519 [Dothidotthia symphoricarpi CBS 119687]KAF2132851.1 hypothetical protein P153DRAFT_283519 [Dothidotthia symphoricarpi CBS 119687]
MNMADAWTQPFNGQRRQLRNEEDAYATGYVPVPATRDFNISDTQGAFTFSAEPAPIVYDSSGANFLAVDASGQDFAFAPHTGSSFDSSLHQDMVTQSYPPPNAYRQAQTHSLSPGSYLGNGQGVSPSHSVEQLSSEAGYVSDLSHQDFSNYPTPSFNGQYLDESFSNLNFTDTTSMNAFPPLQENVDMSLLSSGNLNTYNAQSPIPPSNAPMELHNQLVSHNAQPNSSPMVEGDSSTFPTAHYTGRNSHDSSTSSNLMGHPTLMKQTQSPALTNSPGSTSMPNSRPFARHIAGPIVRVQNFSRDGSPSPSNHSRSLSKISHNSRPSGHHLSPYPQNESSDEDETPHEHVRIQPTFKSTERNEDGSWLSKGGSGQTGLSPGDRQAMEDAWVPNIEELQEQRLKDEKKLEVQVWLTKSEVGSEAGDVAPSNNLPLPFSGRRRAKSTNDAYRRGLQDTSAQARGSRLGLGVHTDLDHGNDENIPGPGIFIDEQSDCDTDNYDDDDDEDNDDSTEPESPPAAIDLQADHADNPYFPPAKETVSIVGIIRPWVDVPAQQLTSSTHYQPPTSNAAMMRFRQRAKDVESASLAATIGSRRLSESDMGSLRAAPGVAKLIEPDPKKYKERQRRSSIMNTFLPKRTQSNLLKRKGSVPVQPSSDTIFDKSKEFIMEKPKRMGSWGRPKSPRVDSNHSNHSKELSPPAPTGLSAPTNPWYQGARNVIKRSRSRSDLGRGKSFGLAELMTQHGGPPMPIHASPLGETEATKPLVQPSPAGDDDDDEQEIVTMDLKVRTDFIIPDYPGFRSHARELNPRLSTFMVERIAQEQMRRYKRLSEFRVKHLVAVKNKTCPSGKFCTDLGGEAKQLPPRTGNKDSDTPFIGFQITAPGSSDEGDEMLSEGAVVSAQFPSGVPLPPVKRLPAEFECPLCFKVKKFYKPSDWTKHVHEDVQPFTCTFQDCGEPKSFKRKADWVRHENERHRQLEYWTCQFPECGHTCYRKDNFVQHLVREHKIAEPRPRTGRASNKDVPVNADQDNVWTTVDNCRHDTTKLPKDEPCRFCGNNCTSWKKLTVHLAKHMEQISMPILSLVEKRQLDADSIISPVVEQPESRKFPATPDRSPIDKFSRVNINSTLAPGLSPYGQYPQDAQVEVASTVMHTYPPPQMVPYRNQHETQNNAYTNYDDNSATNYTNHTYPGLQVPPKPSSAYASGLHTPAQQFHNGSMQNVSNHYAISPVSAVQQQQAIFTNSPIETAFPSYFTQEPQNLANDMPLGYETGMYQQQGGSYPTMQYTTAQNGYQYQR